VNLIKGDGTMIRTAIIFFYIANEGLSILENSVALGLPVPEKLKRVLEQFKEEK
ncbi:MAG: phage holin family protein, partial [Anaerococcus sp.]|nr:phage holin family protein [Anaerococcus sp.]